MAPGGRSAWLGEASSRRHYLTAKQERDDLRLAVADLTTSARHLASDLSDLAQQLRRLADEGSPSVPWRHALARAAGELARRAERTALEGAQWCPELTTTRCGPMRHAAEDVPSPGTDALVPRSSGVISAAGIVMDIDGCAATVRGVPVKLPLVRFDLLKVLVSNPGRVLSTTDLQRSVWGRTNVRYDTVASHMRLLRGAVEPAQGVVGTIATVHRLGYMLIDERAAGCCPR